MVLEMMDCCFCVCVCFCCRCNPLFFRSSQAKNFWCLRRFSHFTFSLRVGNFFRTFAFVFCSSLLLSNYSNYWPAHFCEQHHANICWFGFSECDKIFPSTIGSKGIAVLVNRVFGLGKHIRKLQALIQSPVYLGTLQNKSEFNRVTKSSWSKDILAFSKPTSTK